MGPSCAVATQIVRSSAALVLRNLRDNAVKFSAPGGCVTASLALEDEQVVARVADDGPGIPPDEVPRIFKRCYRGSVPRTTGAAGVGLGLALSQAIAANFGGRIDAANRPEGGAVCTFRLPLHGPAVERPCGR